MRLVTADLADIDPARADGFGGKARGLARLWRAGVRVPPGFAIAAGAPRPNRWRPAERAAFERRLAALLAGGAVAVRSSARAEDGGERSYAGLYETVLGARDAREVEAAIERCLAAASAERVRAYAGGDAESALGLVVQRMVPARTAGVLFTADPRGRHRGTVLEAVAGLGETLVAGRRAPERWSVHLSGRGALEAQRESAHNEPVVLAPGEAERVAAEGRALAARFGGPLDLEWALDAAGALWWLQARPVTALREPPPLPHVERSCPAAKEGPVTLWSRLNVRETLPDAIAPLTWCFWRDLLLPVFARTVLELPPDSPWARELGMLDLVDGRVYFNVNGALAALGEGSAWLLGAVDFEWSAGLAAAGPIERRSLSLPVRERVVASLRALRKVCAALWSGRNPEALLRYFEHYARAARERAAAPLAPLSDAELLAAARRALGEEFVDTARLFAGLTRAVVAFEIARRAFRRHPQAQRMLGVAIAGNPTTEMSLAIDELAEAARPLAPAFLRGGSAEAWLEELAGSDEGRAWLARFEAFLALNGQRCPGEFDLAVPRWSEDPRMLIELVRAELREPAKERMRERMARLAAERERAIAAAIAAAPAWERPWLRACAEQAERQLPLREAGKHHGLHAWLRARTLFVELGARLAARGAIERAEDVFFLTLETLDACAAGALGEGALRARVAAARALHAELAARPAPAFVRSDGVPVTLPEEAEEGGPLRGLGISTGRAVGRVRILRTPDAAALEPGDVLVVRFADPGWTPLFPRAAALVMEVGGLMCHAAVVARELGVPAVFGVRGATQRLRDGERVCVDSEDGTVTPIDEPPGTALPAPLT